MQLGDVLLVAPASHDRQLVARRSLLASAQARNNPAQFLYGQSEETKRTNGLVTP